MDEGTEGLERWNRLPEPPKLLRLDQSLILSPPGGEKKVTGCLWPSFCFLTWNLEMTSLSICHNRCKISEAVSWVVGGKGPKSWQPASNEIQRFLGECNIHQACCTGLGPISKAGRTTPWVWELLRLENEPVPLRLKEHYQECKCK